MLKLIRTLGPDERRIFVQELLLWLVVSCLLMAIWTWLNLPKLLMVLPLFATALGTKRLSAWKNVVKVLDAIDRPALVIAIIAHSIADMLKVRPPYEWALTAALLWSTAIAMRACFANIKIEDEAWKTRTPKYPPPA